MVRKKVEKMASPVSEVLFLIFSRIYYYSTASTSTNDAVYIIGGIDTQNIVAEYKNDQWRQLPQPLHQNRYGHNSIQVENQIFIVGGTDSSTDAM